MRRYDDPVEVRRGMVTGEQGPVEGPEQFLWHGRLWKVYDVVGHWRETGAWWQSREVAPVLGADPGASAPAGTPAGTGTGGTGTGGASVSDLLAQREVWRVEAGRGAATGRGVFDLVFDWAQGSWLLTRCWD
ncbi:hypothetical protein G7072_11625 [Nocardioides sp. HDW12B]|uniref:DUF6504 family protein n=1 Tax=Nocardioides sp. HDW12B TaxID=2714939 RepID=UPI00140D1263|nr:DUF6504 family protein [Nocardioides sp. HDW12B]QIK66907.1 hypothetical protein G7072_11625 [Nocardioides sp. HDW12B]